MKKKNTVFKMNAFTLLPHLYTLSRLKLKKQKAKNCISLLLDFFCCCSLNISNNPRLPHKSKTTETDRVVTHWCYKQIKIPLAVKTTQIKNHVPSINLFAYFHTDDVICKNTEITTMLLLCLKCLIN